MSEELWMTCKRNPKWAAAEIVRLNNWADDMTDSVLNERRLADATIKEKDEAVHLGQMAFDDMKADYERRLRAALTAMENVQKYLAIDGRVMPQLERAIDAIRANADSLQCEHDLVLVHDHNLPSYCWHYRCRKCGAECGNPSELEPVEHGDDIGGKA